ncbi:MAG: ABC transporter substrate-binding protein [Flavobacteriales bacterium]|jgi:peptide/nickel transport system substrate-binding protein|nr:ABC transporter substrate-binding protein [Flavobacteriales bacterium]
MIIKKYFSKLMILLVLLLVLSCQNSGEQKDKMIFRYNEVSNILTLDPAFAKNQAHIWVCNMLYSNLVELDDSLRVVPSVAKKWEIDSSGLYYTFYLREDVQFYHPEIGKIELEAEDFEFSIKRLMDKKTAAPGKWITKDIESVVALAKNELQIKLKSPNSVFLSLMTMKYAAAISKQHYKKVGETYWEKPLGSGPFHYQLWEDKVKMVLRKNPIYFEKDKQGNSLPYLDAVSISFIPDKLTAFLEFIKGNIDFISGIDASYKDEILDKDGELQEKYRKKIRLQKNSYLNTEYLGILVDSNAVYPYNNRAFRKALNFAFDRRLMMKFIRNDIGYPAENGFIPKGLLGFSDEKVFFYNKDSVEHFLSQAEYAKKGSPVIEIHTNNSYLDLCEYIQNSWGNHGIRTEIKVHPPSTLRQKISKQQAPIFRASWIADYPDAENYLSLFFSENWAPNGPNYTHFYNKKFDYIYKKLVKTSNTLKKIDNYRESQAVVLEHAPLIPLYYDEVYLFTNRNTKGLSINPMNNTSLKLVIKSR